ncbi:PIG-P-domain-containing protein [Baffinella frigidus]|nr:PIG-P-domain-containing protein [Cryptophyta sp. CCMP2293]
MQATTRPLPAAVQRQQQGPPHGAKAAEVYGIVGYLLSSVAFILWLLWAYTPDWVLQALSITYYPERYWAVALPGYFFLLVLYLIILYNGSFSRRASTHLRLQRSCKAFPDYCKAPGEVSILVDTTLQVL